MIQKEIKNCHHSKDHNNGSGILRDTAAFGSCVQKYREEVHKEATLSPYIRRSLSKML